MHCMPFLAEIGSMVVGLVFKCILGMIGGGGGDAVPGDRTAHRLSSVL